MHGDAQSMVNTRLITCGLVANKKRNGNGTLNTHCLIGLLGNTPSTRCAALSAMRLAPQDGQNPRRLQLNATNFS